MNHRAQTEGLDSIAYVARDELLPIKLWNWGRGANRRSLEVPGGKPNIFPFPDFLFSDFIVQGLGSRV